MPGQPDSGEQKAAAGHDANIAGRDQVFVNIAGGAVREPAVPGLLPRDVPGFTGRGVELDRLAGLAGGGSVVVTAIGGTAGVGKTALAVHAAYRLLPRFPDGHLYADLRGYTEGQAPMQSGEVLDVFLRRLGVPAEEMTAGIEERSGLLRQLLASRRVLMLLDNAGTEAQVRPLLPGAGGSLVLITSRSVLPGLEVDERIDLDVLPEGEATALLVRLIGAERVAAEPQTVVQVRDWCGRLPLALRIVGQLLAAHPAWPVARLAEMLADERDRLGRLAVGDLQVQAAFAVSYRELADGDARMFRLLGLHPGPNFETAAAASLAGVDAEAAGPVLNRLVLAHLVTEDVSGRFRMHDLLRLFARGTCQETDDQATRDVAEDRLVGHYVARAIFLNACLNPLKRSEVAEVLPSLRQAVAMLEAERPNLLAALGLAAGRGQDQQVWQLSEMMGGQLMQLRYLDDVLTIAEAALAAARHAGDTAAEGRALTNLGNTYDELERFGDAIGSCQDALVIFREIGDRRSEGQTLNILCTSYRKLQRFEEAVGSCQDALVIFREIGDRRSEGQALGSLGNIYEVLGRDEDAIGCYQDALVIFQAIGDRYNEGQTLHNFGLTYQKLQRFEDAIGSCEDALAISREMGDRHHEGMILTTLGDTYQDLRQPERAAAYWRDAAAISRKAGDHEATARLEQKAASAQPRKRRWRRNS